MQLLGNQANSIYHSLQVTLTKRYSHGLYLLAGYTYAHAIDTSTSNTAGVPQNSLNYNAERGNGDYDIRNRFTLSVDLRFAFAKVVRCSCLRAGSLTSIVNSGRRRTVYARRFR